MGVSGSGKSTVAATLVDRLGWEFAEGDDFHPAANVEKMRAGHPLDDEDRWPWLRSLAAWIGEHERAGRSVVVTCSALKRSYRDLLRDGHPSVWFAHVTATPELIRERVEHRTGALHAGHRCSTPSSPPSSRWLTTNPGARVSGAGSPPSWTAELLAALDAERGLHRSAQEARHDRSRRSGGGRQRPAVDPRRHPRDRPRRPADHLAEGASVPGAHPGLAAARHRRRTRRSPTPSRASRPGSARPSAAWAC